MRQGKEQETKERNSSPRNRIRTLSLLELLCRKGLITGDEVKEVGNTDDLIVLLESKGLIEAEDLQELILDNTVLVLSWFDLIRQKTVSSEELKALRIMSAPKHKKVMTFLEGLINNDK